MSTLLQGEGNESRTNTFEHLSLFLTTGFVLFLSVRPASSPNRKSLYIGYYKSTTNYFIRTLLVFRKNESHILRQIYYETVDRFRRVISTHL